MLNFMRTFIVQSGLCASVYIFPDKVLVFVHVRPKLLSKLVCVCVCTCMCACVVCVCVCTCMCACVVCVCVHVCVCAHKTPALPPTALPPKMWSG